MNGDEVKRLKINDLRLISAIAKHGQISIAADELSISQPSASRTLADIETGLGAAIFIRHPKGMNLTEIGQSITVHADNMLAGMQDLSREIEELKLGRKGIVRVGSVTGPAIRYVVPAVQRLKELSPLSEIHIEVSSSSTLMRELVQENLDFVFCRMPTLYQPQNFDLISAETEQVDLVVHKRHPLADNAKVSLDELVGFDWVIQPRGAPIRQAVEAAFHQNNTTLPTNITNTTSLLVMLAMLANSDGIAPMSQELSHLLCGEKISSDLVTLKVSVKIEVSPYYLINMRNRAFSPIIRQLKNLVLEEIARDQYANFASLAD